MELAARLREERKRQATATGSQALLPRFRFSDRLQANDVIFRELKMKNLPTVTRRKQEWHQNPRLRQLHRRALQFQVVPFLVMTPCKQFFDGDNRQSHADRVVPVGRQGSLETIGEPSASPRHTFETVGVENGVLLIRCPCCNTVGTLGNMSFSVGAPHPVEF